MVERSVSVAVLGAALLLGGCGKSGSKPATPPAPDAANVAVSAPATATANSATPAAAAAVTPGGPAAAASVSAVPPCSQADAAQADAALQPLVGEVDSDVATATNTARGALSGPIGQMESTRQRLDSMGLPPCATAAVEAFDNYLNARITEFSDFQKAAPNAQVSQDDAVAVGLQQPVVADLAALQHASVTVTPSH